MLQKEEWQIRVKFKQSEQYDWGSVTLKALRPGYEKNQKSKVW